MENVLQTFRNLGTVRLVAMGGVAIGLIAFFVFLTSRLNSTEMSLLYGDLEPADSGKIVQQLESMGVEYQLRAGGRQILVPADRALRLRMTMAEAGLPSGGSVGYEIFDRSDGFGTTSFVQNVNLLRALEGELARTIRSLSQVEEARVHLVMPRRELFSRARQEPSASVLLKTRGSTRLEKSEIVAIEQLVAAAVPGLQPSRISIVDSRGRLLARAGDEDDAGTIALNTDELRRAQEDRMARVIESLLEQSVGVGKVRAQVNADIDFDRVSTNIEKYDPDGQVVRSTQTVEESTKSTENQLDNAVSVTSNLPDNQTEKSGDKNSNQTTRNEETTNFEISKTVSKHVRESGVVRRLSVAVMVDGTYEKGPNGEVVYKPRSAEEMQKLRKLVASAVGFDEKRGDRLDLINMRFVSPGDAINAMPEPFFGLNKADLFRIGEIFVLAVIGVLVILLVVRPLVARTLDALPSAIEAAKEHPLLADQSEEAPALAGPQAAGVSGQIGVDEDEEAMIDLDLVEGRVKASTIKKITEIVERHPEETVGILRQWMYAE